MATMDENDSLTSDPSNLTLRIAIGLSVGLVSGAAVALWLMYGPPGLANLQKQTAAATDKKKGQ